MGEIASRPSRASRVSPRYWVAGAATLAAVGLGVLLFSGRSAKQPSREETEQATPAAAAAPAAVAATTPVPEEPKPVAAAPIAAAPISPAEPPAAAEPATITFKIEGAREEITVKVDGKSVPANAPIRLPRDRAIHTVRVSSAHFAPETFSKRADGNRTFHLKNELRLLTAPGN